MSEKKARASVFFVIAIIAFICSCILFSMTGGVSDWVGDVINNDTDENTTDDFGLSEFLNISDDSEENTYNSYDSSSGSSGSSSSNSDESSSFLNDLTSNNESSKSSNSSEQSSMN